MKVLRGFFLAVLMIAAALGAGFVIWGSNPLQPMPEALQALESDERVTVTEGRWTVFQPAGRAADTGFIFYPGGRVDYRAYAPLARSLAEEGFLVVLAPMPLSLAVLNPGAAGEIIPAFPEVRAWAVGGHSLGGAMAASYAARNPDQVEGVVLVASYPASSDSLAEKEVRVISIYGSLDGLATGDKIESSRSLLPESTRWVEIAGGNHAQFGSYGEQGGDREAEISREDQQAQAAAAITAFLRSMQEVAQR